MLAFSFSFLLVLSAALSQAHLLYSTIVCMNLYYLVKFNWFHILSYYGLSFTIYTIYISYFVICLSRRCAVKVCLKSTYT